MRTVEYEQFPAIGAGTIEKTGSLRDLVLAIPSLRMFDLMPPLSVLNTVLREGIVEAGMSGGCRGQPLEVTPSEYDELVRSFSADPHDHFEPLDVPAWVETRRDWGIWVEEYVRRVPAAEHRRLVAEYEALQRQRKAAQESGDSELAETLFVEEVRAGTKLGDFIMGHLGKDSGH